MKAYLIDPSNRSVTEVEYTGNYRNINTHLSGEGFDVQYFTAVYTAVIKEDGTPDHTKPMDVFVDDEGLINENPFGWFTIKGYGGLLRGKGLVLGHNDEGDSVSPNVTLAEVTKAVGFPSEFQAQMMMLASGM